MKITSKHKMKDLKRMMFILTNSDDNLLDKIKAYDVPTEINGIKVKPYKDISIDNMLDIWDIKTTEQLYKMTAEAFLDLDEKEIPELPLIDFIRLTQYTEEIAILVAELFKKLHREPEDIRIVDILSKYKSNQFGIVARFCSMFPAYTLEQASQLPWTVIYLAFENKTIEYDIELEKSKLK